MDKGLLAIIGVSTFIIIGAIIVCSISIVPAGYRGVHDLFGQVSEQELQPGFHFKNFFAGVTMMSVKTQEYTMSFVVEEGAVKGKSDVISALTKEGLPVDLDMTVLYKLVPERADEIYKTIGVEYVGVIVRPQIRAGIREVVAKYEAKTIYSEDRTKVALEIQELLITKVEPRGIIIEEVLLRHVQLPAELTKAIEAKLTAEQDIEKRRFQVDVEKQEADRKRVEAQGIADANNIISESLTSEYLTWYWIENLDKHESVLYVPVGNAGIPLFKEAV